MNLNLTQDFKIVDATAGPVTTNGGVTSDYVSVKNAVKAWVLVQLTQAVGHATAVTLQRATAVDGTGVTTLGSNVAIWLNEDTAASDTLVRQTDAKVCTVTNNIKKKMIVFEIDVAALGDYDVINFTVGDSSQATNFVSGVFILQERFAQATPPAAITD